MSDPQPEPQTAPKAGRGVLLVVLGVLGGGSAWIWAQWPEPLAPRVEIIGDADEGSASVEAVGEPATTEPPVAVSGDETPIAPVTEADVETTEAIATSEEADSAIVAGENTAPAEVKAESADAGGIVEPASGARDTAEVEPADVSQVGETATSLVEDPAGAPETTATEAASTAEDTNTAPSEQTVTNTATGGEPQANANDAPSTVETAEATPPAADPAQDQGVAGGAQTPEIEVAAASDPPPERVEPRPTPEPRTNALAPTFDLIRIDATGSGVIAGQAEPNSTVQIIAGSTTIATAEADAAGEFVAFIQTPDQDEGLQLSLLAQSGTEAAEGNEDVLVLPVETEGGEALAPTVVKADAAAETVRIIQPSSLGKVAGVTLDAISYDSEGAVRLSGRAPGPQDIRIYVDGTAIGVARSSAAGTWDARLTGVSEGRYVLRVDALRADGTVTSRAESPFQRVYPTAEQRQNPTQITVQPGNTLWVMAQDRYGDGFLYTQIFSANRDAIRDPDLIYPGQIFTLPTEDDFIQ